MSDIVWNTVRDEFGITVRHQWNAQPAKEELTTAEWEELLELRRQLRRVQSEYDVLLAKAAAWFVGRSDATPAKSSDL